MTQETISSGRFTEVVEAGEASRAIPGSASELLPFAIAQELLEAASRAPSPDNNQPWAFRYDGNAIHLYHCRDRAIPSDVNDLFSWLALGAAVENIVLAASRHGLRGSVKYHARPFEREQGHEHVMTVQFDRGAAPDSLGAHLADRVTNRKPYQARSLEAEECRTLADAVQDSNGRVLWLTKRRDLKALARLVFVADRVRFEHRPFHEELHHVLRYNQTEAQIAGDGLELASLEIPRLAWPLMRWLRPWNRMALANRFGLSRLFARNSIRQIVASGGVGLLSTSDTSDTGLLRAGRSLQRIWLAATGLGLAFQPVGALPLFLFRLEVSGQSAFQPRHAQALGNLRPEFEQLFPDRDQRLPVMLFRVGRSRPPSARSVRLPLQCIQLD